MLEDKENKSAELLTKALAVQELTIKSELRESENQREIKKYESDTALSIHREETRRLSLWLEVYKHIEKRKTVKLWASIAIATFLLFFSSYLLYVEHRYGATVFFSVLSFIAGVGLGKGVFSEENTRENSTEPA